jgi:hypothetical protein
VKIAPFNEQFNEYMLEKTVTFLNCRKYFDSRVGIECISDIVAFAQLFH